MVDWSRLPSLSALRAFCAFVQTGSVTDAGAALNVSHAAISQ
ncbi:LysR family transcriptional regulator [Marivita sp.]|jgi:LysR family glycine cleavage system transcriptional activator